MIIAGFLTLLAATLAFGAWLATRWTRAGVEITSTLAAEQRGWAVCDEADMATDGDEVWL